MIGALIRFLLPLLLLPLLCCCGVPLREQLPELALRHPPSLTVGQELPLLDKPPLAAAALLAADGHLHLFALTDTSEVEHWQLRRDGVVNHEVIGQLAGNKLPDVVTMRAVEYPRGGFHVLAAGGEYVRKPGEATWQQRSGCRCLSYLTTGGKLLCAGLISGDEIGLAKRTDWSGGLLVILPVAWYRTVLPTKLALLEEQDSNWLLRAVVDPLSDLDVTRISGVGIDQCGTLHLVFYESRGGVWFFIGGGPGGAGGFGGGYQPVLRYARLPLTADDYSQAVGDEATPESLGEGNRWLEVASSKLFPPRYAPSNPDFSTGEIYGQFSWDGLFMVNAPRCQVEAYSVLRTGWQVAKNGGEISIPENETLLTEIGLQNGSWDAAPQIVVGSGVPAPELDDWWQIPYQIVIDSRGDSHLLVRHVKVGFWSGTTTLAYLERIAGEWSSPLALGTVGGSKIDFAATSDILASTGNGDFFVAWVNEQQRYVGKWLLSSEPEP